MASPEEVPVRPERRWRIIGGFFLVLLVVLVVRLFMLQVPEHASSERAVASNSIETISLPAMRGLILDRNGTPLVMNKISTEIRLSRARAALSPSVIGTLSSLTGLSVKQILADINNVQYNPYQPALIVTSASTSEVDFIKLHPAEFPGVTIETVAARAYPDGGTLAPNVVGYLGDVTSAELQANPNAGYSQDSQIGQTGIEAQYNKQLQGVNGTQSFEVAANGQVAATFSTKPPKPGDTIVLNIDSKLQKVAQRALQADVYTDKHTLDPVSGKYPAASSAAAVVLDPQTGAVLALASYPTYSLNEWIGGISQANYNVLSANGGLSNFAIQGLYTPGSSFKLATATAALQTGLVQPYWHYHDTGTFTIPNCKAGCFFHDDAPSDAGMIDLPFAITESDDDYFYNLGYQFYLRQAKYGPTPIQNAAYRYGLGEYTGIDLPDEAQGRVDSYAERVLLHKEAPAVFPPATWYPGDNVEMAFGQGETLLTPIEEAVAYATFANGGTRYQPEVATAEINPTTGKVVKRFKPKVTGHVSLPGSIYGPILQGLEGVVDNPAGTAYGTFHQYATFSLNQFRIAGKTGTATIAAHDLKEPDAWFVGFGPIPHPKYVVVVAVGQGGYGDAAAAPAVMNIFNYLVRHPVGPLVLHSTLASGVQSTSVRAKKSSTTTSPRG
jgi:penicillin-binding protein 2